MSKGSRPRSNYGKEFWNNFSKIDWHDIIYCHVCKFPIPRKHLELYPDKFIFHRDGVEHKNCGFYSCAIGFKKDSKTQLD